LAFQNIRKLFGIEDKDYIYTLGPERILGNILLGNISTFEEVSIF